MVIYQKSQSTTTCVLIFFVFLLGVCNNYALKRTAEENEKKYGTEIAHSLRENFYVDDLLKSINSGWSDFGIWGVQPHMHGFAHAFAHVLFD